MKTLVLNKKENERVPFHRGILISSLLDAGLSFEDADELASTVRNELKDVELVTSEELQTRVSLLLEKPEYEEILVQYRSPSVVPSKILVTSLSGTQTAFSRGRHTRYLQSTGMKAEKAEPIT